MEPVTTSETFVQGSYGSKWWNEFKYSLDPIEATVKCFLYWIIGKKATIQQSNMVKRVPKSERNNYTLNLWDPLFWLRVLNINVPVKPHLDMKNILGLLLWTCPFGKYEGGYMVCPQTGRKFLYRPGSIFGVNGRNVVHYATEWYGEGAERCVVGRYLR